MKFLDDFYCDVLIIGSGAAGLSLAIRLAPYYRVIVLSKSQLKEGSTLYAQGGIAAVFDETDSIESHIADTLIAGAGLCDANVVNFVTTNAKHCVQWLIDQGVIFDKNFQTHGKINYHLTREGGHSHRRILHHADATGHAIETTLVHEACNQSNISIFEYTRAIDLILSDKIEISGKRRVLGAWFANYHDEQVKICRARAVVLATGGAATVYQYTTNPDVISGDGIAIAWRAGCRVANLEFNQFHPTCLYHPYAKNFLLTEALRGEGAWLLRPDGTRFMPDFDYRAELAPRDIVARSINYEMKRLRTTCMYLDISRQSEDFIYSHFPNIYKKLIQFDIDITKQPIPIVPAAHYTCGGVVVDLQGRTDIDGLYAIGEVSYTGLHGANRMASNSLLECLVYGWSAAEHIIHNLPKMTMSETLPSWNKILSNKLDNVVIQRKRHELKACMWDYMGIVRTNQDLDYLKSYIKELQYEIDDYYANFGYSNQLLELRNLVQVSLLMVRCALERKESRGLHYTLDFLILLDKAVPTILIP
ncbi:L-aspartate oxidase [Candidatus Pantoea carbekii]|uniref:L-aspartate oxidase n=1 Tax=Candidatus Pantoea carbekii TaxID=1235990 RepID=UPI0006187721|nr:L-aspartate oxidase [Candidatus Pantoea carbekii]AKC31876.1 L-aspartate oxidase NadB [Candidatus Pantoea carbekii]